jgi:hypothetical protein
MRFPTLFLALSVSMGVSLFETIGCADCHIPTMATDSTYLPLTLRPLDVRREPEPIRLPEIRCEIDLAATAEATGRPHPAARRACDECLR